MSTAVVEKGPITEIMFSVSGINTVAVPTGSQRLGVAASLQGWPPVASIQIYFFWRGGEILSGGKLTDSLTFHAVYVPMYMYLDLHKQLFYIAHK